MDRDGYGAREGQSDIERLLEDARTLSPLGVERAAQGWQQHAGGGTHAPWHEAERAALHALERTRRTQEWDDLRNLVLGLTEHRGALIAWRLEHGETGHRAERALLGAALALLTRPSSSPARISPSGSSAAAPVRARRRRCWRRWRRRCPGSPELLPEMTTTRVPPACRR
jgi:hypothetical protein